jgi:ATP-dependent Clp protease ATP-binding subunit ClpC
VLAEWRASREEKRVVVDEEDILHVVSKWTGIPLKRMEEGEAAAAAGAGSEMEKVIIGQAKPSPPCARRCAARAPT